MRKYVEKYLNIMQPRYGERILSVPWHFVITRFHCNLASGAEFAIVSFKVNVTFFFSVNLEHNSLTSFGGLVNLVNLKVKAT